MPALGDVDAAKELDRICPCAVLLNCERGCAGLWPPAVWLGLAGLTLARGLRFFTAKWLCVPAAAAKRGGRGLAPKVLTQIVAWW